MFQPARKREPTNSTPRMNLKVVISIELDSRVAPHSERDLYSIDGSKMNTASVMTSVSCRFRDCESQEFQRQRMLWPQSGQNVYRSPCPKVFCLTPEERNMLPLKHFAPSELPS